MIVGQPLQARTAVRAQSDERTSQYRYSARRQCQDSETHIASRAHMLVLWAPVHTAALASSRCVPCPHSCHSSSSFFQVGGSVASHSGSGNVSSETRSVF